MSSDQDLREKARLAYQEKRIREKLIIQQALQKQDEQSQNFLGSEFQQQQNNHQQQNLVSQLANVAFQNPSSLPTTKAPSTASSIDTLQGDTVLQGFHGQNNNSFLSRGNAPANAKSLFDSSSSSSTSPSTSMTMMKSAFDIIQEKRRQLPVYQKREELIQTVAQHQVVCLQSDTGSGKTTQIPQFLLEAGYKKVVCTQPRVLAATSVAERVAQEMGVACGSKVGYKVRFESRATDRTELLFVTDGMLLKECMTDPKLSEYGAIMIDEAHERSVNSDLLLGLVRDLIRERKDLRVIVASATMMSEKFLNFFGPDVSTKFEIPGRQFAVKSFFLGEAQEDYVESAAQVAFQTHIEKDLPGDILVFLTGQDDIEKCEARLTELLRNAGDVVRELIILPLYSALPMDRQRLIYEPAPKGTRKVILATNVAETSITIDGIVYVIDSGLCKQKFYDPKTGTEALAVVPISKAAALQRKGRAGRTREGECIRLYTKQVFQLELDPDPAPEILRTSLTSVVLTLKSLGVHNFAAFDFVDPPAPDAVAEAMKTLLILGAVNSSGHLCKTGRLMAELPLDPHLSKMLLHAQTEMNCGKQATTVVAILSLQNSLFYIPKDKRNTSDSTLGRFFWGTCGDLTGYYQVFSAWESERCSKQWASAHFLNYLSALRAREIRNQLVGTLLQITSNEFLTNDCSNSISAEDAAAPGLNAVDSSLTRLDNALTKSFLAGFFMNAALLSADMVSFTIAKTKTPEAFIHPSSCYSQVMTRRRQQEQQKEDEKRQLMLRTHNTNTFDSENGATKFRFCDPDTQKPVLISFAEMRCTPRIFMTHVMSVREDWVREAAPTGFFKKGELGNSASAAMANNTTEDALRRRQREVDVDTSAGFF